jgi:hypothetical protein
VAGRPTKGEPIYAVQHEVENQVINGNGTAPNLRGIPVASGIQTTPFDTDKIDTARNAITSVESLGYLPSAFVFNPSDWADVEKSRASTSGVFDISTAPVDRSAQRLWSTSVVSSSAIAPGTELLLSQGSVVLNVDAAGALVD